MKYIKKSVALFLCLMLAFAVSTTAFAAVEDTGFSDVDADAWYAGAVEYCVDNGLMSGTGTTTFAPDAVMTRAMLATVLYREAGSPAVSGTDTFSDTQGGAWYGDAVLWASQNGIISGYGNGLFGTNDPVTREQIAAILWRYEGSPAPDGTAEAFSDQASISAYAVDAVAWARENVIINGMDGNRFAPKNNATRAQVATILANAFRDGAAEPAPSPDAEPSSRVLVAYFSATGNTGRVAEEIARAADADLFEIVPEDPYTSADLNYSNSSCRAILEQRDDNARPAITQAVENLSDYDVVFLGYPIWSGQAPKVIYAFLESCEGWDDQTIIPFCTSGGSGIGSSATNLHGLITDTVTWQAGNRFSGSASQASIDQWVDGLDIPRQENDTTAESPRMLIAYFSHSGNTEQVAQAIEAQTGADMFEIVPAVPYPEDFNATADRWHEERDSDARPEIVGRVENMEDYDIIFLGYPIWSSQLPAVNRTFLEQYDFSGKTIVPFCTHGGSAFGSSIQWIESLAPGATLLDGYEILGENAAGCADEVAAWLSELGLDQ